MSRASSDDLSESGKAPQRDALIFTGTDWQPLVPGSVSFGPELSFGKSMSARGQLGIIKTAVGGTSLAKDWSPSRAGSLYFKTLEVVQSAKVTRPVKIAGVLRMQGETDASDPGMAKTYGGNLSDFIQALRRDLGDQTIPFAACRVNPIDPIMAYVSDVRSGQEDVSLPGYQWFDCDGLAKQADGVHYTAAGEIDLGNLFADAMIRLSQTK